MERPYFHLRDDSFRHPQINLDMLRRVFGTLLRDYEQKGYLQHSFGYTCVDEGVVAGEKGSSLASYLLTDALISTRDPVWQNLYALTAKKILGMHEAIFHIVAKPLQGRHHDYANCGWHYTSFDSAAGQAEYVEAANKYLSLFPPGYKLTRDGVLELLMDEPASMILDAPLPDGALLPLQERVRRAVRKFRNGLCSWDDREAAVRDLGDVLECIRVDVRKQLTRADEGAIFESLNGFGIRHMRADQKDDYDRPIFLTWFFYEMLAAIHACVRLIERDENRVR